MFFSLEMTFSLDGFGFSTAIKPRIQGHFEFFMATNLSQSRFFKA